ncbi:MAG TPA: peptidylprolyl isomerase [Candidatus Dormibacteraeota bacterium]|nr:peptidylprolyl isomerase [Candidatus Dormibacteraeota bacterium]
MMLSAKSGCLVVLNVVGLSLVAAPAIDPIANASIPAGKSLLVPVTASSSNGRALTFTATSSTNQITVEVKTNNPFWKLTVVQAAPSNAPGAFPTPFRGGIVTVTNLGDMTFMLFKDVAPRTVDVFSGLTSAGFYNSNTIFHRVVPGFVIQGGDPQTNGTGGPVFRYDDEFSTNALFSGHGQLALANSGKDTDGSQFFVTYGPQRFLDLGYTLVGQLLRGFNVLTNVINTTNSASRPLADVIITRASLVPDTTDTVLLLTGTNLAGVSGTIKVIADDGAGGLATNSFTATTIVDTQNEPPILRPVPITNKFCPINGRLTNFIAGFDMEGNAFSYVAGYQDAASLNNSTNSTINGVNGQLVVVPNTNYSGPLNLYVQVGVSSVTDQQLITFAVGDVPITAFGTSFVASASAAFSNQLVATFTNGIANSATSNFTASINWGDNSVTSGTIQTNLLGVKEVRGSHTYTNSGNYSVLVTINSYLGADASVTTTAVVPPAVSLSRAGTNSVLKWPDFAFDYQLQSNTNLSSSGWGAVTNVVRVVGYENTVTNATGGSNRFFRLKR